MPTAADDLRALMASRHGLLVVDTRDEPTLLATAAATAQAANAQLWQWTVSDGLQISGGHPPPGSADRR